jgi:hypothetical protein
VSLPRSLGNRPLARAFAAAGLFTLWQEMLFWGWAGGGAVHLLLAAALAAFPWRAASLGSR